MSKIRMPVQGKKAKRGLCLELQRVHCKTRYIRILLKTLYQGKVRLSRCDCGSLTHICHLYSIFHSLAVSKKCFSFKHKKKMAKSTPFRFKRTKQSSLSPITTTNATMQNELVTERKKTLHKSENSISPAGRSLLKSLLATRDRQHRRPFMQLSTENKQLHARLFSGNRARSEPSAVHAFLDSTKAAFTKTSRSSQLASSNSLKAGRSPSLSNWQTGTASVLASKVGEQLSPIFSSLLHYNLDDLEEIGSVCYCLVVWLKILIT